MKKTLFSIFALAAVAAANAQVTLYDNGPFVTHPGGGFNGADASCIGTDSNTFGLNRKFFGPDLEYFTVADDFVATGGTLQKVHFYGYETNANNPTWTGFTANLWDGTPGAGGAVVATATSVTFAPLNCFRVTNTTFTSTARKINEIIATFNDFALTPGKTYWVSCQVTTGGASGWANMVMDPNPGNPNDPITRKGNALMYRQDPVTLLYGWLSAEATAGPTPVQVEFPFVIKGQGGATTETLAPVSEQVIFGTTNSGGNLASWAADDNNSRTICKLFVPSVTSPFVRVALNYTTTKTSPTAISFNVKVSNHTPGPQAITLALQDKTNSNFVNTSVAGAASIPGTTYNGAATGTLANYVGTGGAMTGRIDIFQTGPSTSLFPCSSFEFAQMVVTG